MNHPARLNCLGNTCRRQRHAAPGHLLRGGGRWRFRRPTGHQLINREDAIVVDARVRRVRRRPHPRRPPHPCWATSPSAPANSKNSGTSLYPQLPERCPLGVGLFRRRPRQASPRIHNLEVASRPGTGRHAHPPQEEISIQPKILMYATAVAPTALRAEGAAAPQGRHRDREGPDRHRPGPPRRDDGAAPAGRTVP